MTVEGSPAPETSLPDRIHDANKRLADEFRGRVTVQDVERLSLESLQPYRNAPIQDFVPLFVERETRQRLRMGLGGETAA